MFRGLLKATPLALIIALIACMSPPFAAAKSQKIVIGTGPEFWFDAGISPSLMPRQQPAPIALSVSGGLYTGAPAQWSLSRIPIEFDRQGILTPEDLPTCRRKLLAHSSAAAGRRACRDSIVGSGTAEVSFAIPGQAVDMAAPPVLTVFNGGSKGSITTLYVQGAIGAPLPETIVATVKVRPIDDGPYGLRAVTTIPPIDHGQVLLRGFKLNFKPRFASLRCREGTARSMLSGFSFNDGESISSEVTVTRPVSCRASAG